MIKYLEKDNFYDVIKKGVYLVDFYGEWCSPCRFMSSQLEKLGDEYNILKVDIDKFEELFDSFRIMAIPALVFFKDGERKAELLGFHDLEDIKETYKKLEDE